MPLILGLLASWFFFLPVLNVIILCIHWVIFMFRRSRLVALPGFWPQQPEHEKNVATWLKYVVMLNEHIFPLPREPRTRLKCHNWNFFLKCQFVVLSVALLQRVRGASWLLSRGLAAVECLLSWYAVVGSNRVKSECNWGGVDYILMLLGVIDSHFNPLQDNLLLNLKIHLKYFF